MLARVSESRRKELNGIRGLLAIRSANQAIALSIPTLAAVVVFAVYSVTGHGQSPATIWTSISLLNLLRFPLMMLPNSLSTITDAASACKRLVPVFLAEDLPEKAIEIIKDNKYALEVKQASFEWERGSQNETQQIKKNEKEEEKKLQEKPFRLENISLAVPKGSLLCVVGTVGSGKSSLLQGLVGEMRRTEGEVIFGELDLGLSSFSFFFLLTNLHFDRWSNRLLCSASLDPECDDSRQHTFRSTAQ